MIVLFDEQVIILMLDLNVFDQNIKVWLESAVPEQNVPTLWKEAKSLSKIWFAHDNT